MEHPANVKNEQIDPISSYDHRQAIDKLKEISVVAASLFSIPFSKLEGSTLEKHTLTVAYQFEKYFAKGWNSQLISLNHFRSILDILYLFPPGLHTIDSGESTNSLFKILESAGLTPEEIRIARQVIILKNTIKNCMNGKMHVSDAAFEVAESADKLDVNPEELLSLLRILYICDVASYTEVANPVDNTVVFDTTRAEVALSEPYQKRYLEIKSLLPTNHDFYIGTNDAGFDSRRFEELKTQIIELQTQISKQINDDNQEIVALIQELYTDEDLKFNPRFKSRMVGIPRTVTVNTTLSREEKISKKRRLDMLMPPLGRSAEISALYDKLQGKKRELVLEGEKKADSQDLSEVFVELQAANLLPEELNSEVDNKLVKAEGSLSFPGMEERPDSPELSEDSRNYIRRRHEIVHNMFSTEIWFHVSRHIQRIITNHGLSTQSWLMENDFAYYAILVRNSGAQGEGQKDPKLSSPLNRQDIDRIFFRADTLEHYGDSVIAYMPEDILPNTGLFLLPRGVQHEGERVISDIADADTDTIPTSGKSRLKLPLASAFVAVPKEEFRETCRILLKEGYSQTWIKDHVFSYRGNSRMRFVGKMAVVTEIRRRVKESRTSSARPNIIIVPNPKKEVPNLYQIIT